MLAFRVNHFNIYALIRDGAVKETSKSQTTPSVSAAIPPNNTSESGDIRNKEAAYQDLPSCIGNALKKFVGSFFFFEMDIFLLVIQKLM